MENPVIMEPTQTAARPLVPESDKIPSIVSISVEAPEEDVDATVTQQEQVPEEPSTDVVTAVKDEEEEQQPSSPSESTSTTTAAAAATTTTTTTTTESDADAPTATEVVVERSVSRLEEHDSLVTVRLSEPPVLSVNTASTATRDLMSSSNNTLPDDLILSPATTTASGLHRATMPTVNEDDTDSITSMEDEPVNWEQLQQTENEECNGQNADNTAMLLARLEQENAKLATNPKSVRVKERTSVAQTPRRIRPPSVAQLRDMVQGPTPPALRYSMLPPPPMTDLEFYAALVQDFHQTAARLPTLLSNKVHKGIPPPLRGVVWQGMTGATRDTALGDQFDKYSDATSPYEGIIGKDLGRSFPGVDMFREPDGDGQRMLGRVLKSYSLHEPEIGYCQGLAFLVGPLLMHMPDKEAFCVLVKLMENYDLRSSYMPDLAGLHLRIYQFRELLRSTLPVLSAHLDELQVDPAAYVSQWFLSFFAVTCPLPMLFRMYDVVFAEGAAETIMRVALSLMQHNEVRLLACSELEDAMQLLLSRGLWECYHYNADEFVLDFLNLSDVVTRDRLAALNQAYRESQIANRNQTDNDGTGDRSSALSTIASRFLGRLWASTSSPSSSTSPNPANAASSSSSSTANSSSAPSPNPNSSSSSAPLASPTLGSSFANNLSLGFGSALSAPLRPRSMQRSSSKHSLASTVNSMEVSSSAAGQSSSTSSSSSSSSSSSVLSASTDATSVSRDSETELHGSSTKSITVASSSGSNKSGDNNRFLHNQIEDLLTALGDLQRQHALATDQLQQEREERKEDYEAVLTLLQELRDRCTEKAVPAAADDDATATTTTTSEALSQPMELSISQVDLFALFQPVEARYKSIEDTPQTAIAQTKSELREELNRTKQQLAHELSKSQDHERRVYGLEQEVAATKEQLREGHARVRVLHQDKQRLERQIHEMRTRMASEAASTGAGDGSDAASGGHSVADTASDWFSRATGSTGSSIQLRSGGLRELKLVRSKSIPTPAHQPAHLTTSASAPSFAITPLRSNSMDVRTHGSRASQASRASRASQEPVLGSASEQPSTISDKNNDNNSSNSNDQQPDALVLELVQSKTSEAVARQEAEEARQKLESLRKALGLSANDMSMILHSGHMSNGSAVASAASTAKGILGKLTTSMSLESNNNNSSSSSSAGLAAAAANAAGGPRAVSTGQIPPSNNNNNNNNNTGYGFFGWRR